MAILASLPLLMVAQLPSAGMLIAGLAIMQCPHQVIRLAGMALLLVWTFNDACIMVRDIEQFAAGPATFSVRISEVR